MNYSKLKKMATPALIILLALLITIGLKLAKPEAEEEKHEFPPLSVDVSLATYTENSVASAFQGQVRAKTDIELVTQVTGKVMVVSDNFIEGGKFEAGEVLLQIDDADYQVALKSAQASVATAQVDLDIELASAATNAREWQDLQKRSIDEASPLRLNKPQVDRARAKLDAAKAELAAANLNYQRTKISAPFAGRIMTKTAELGQFMSRGASIGRVFATQAMEIRIAMTDVQIGELGLTLGFTSSAENQAPVVAAVSAVFGVKLQQWQGYLKSIDASIDDETRLLYATVVVEEPFANNAEQTMSLAPGLFVDVELQSAQVLAGLRLPRTALRNGSYVYVVEDEKLRLAQVNVAYTSDDFVILVDDATQLSRGDTVIISAVPGAYDGMPVLENNRNEISTQKIESIEPESDETPSDEGQG